MWQMTKKQQQEYAVPRARELARSGRFSNWLAIELELHYEEGVSEARFCLDDDRIREELDRMCADALKGPADAPRPQRPEETR